MKNINIEISDNAHKQLSILAAKYSLDKRAVYRYALEFAALDPTLDKAFERLLELEAKVNARNN